VTHQSIKIIDGPLEHLETYLIEDRMMRLYDEFRLQEPIPFKVRLFKDKVDDIRNNRPPKTHAYYIYMLTPQGLKFVR
jgi:hypothetical protein